MKLIRRSLLGRGLLGAVTLAIALPLTVGAQPAAHHQQTAHRHHLVTTGDSPAVEFGIQGGNIRPWTVQIMPDGTVQGQVSYGPTKKSIATPAVTLQGLAALADGEGFFSMAPSTQCSGVLPDIATTFVTMHTLKATKTVRVHGGCNANFNQLVAVLSDVARG